MPTTCHCGASWTGRRIEHCTECHQTFTGASSGDRHRVGDFNVRTGPKRRRCLSADEMWDRGMEQNARGVWTNGGTSPWASGEDAPVPASRVVAVAPAGGEVAPEAAGDEIGREGGAEGFACSIDAPHGPHPVQTSIAGGEPGPLPVEWRYCPGSTICDPGCPLLGCPDCPTEASNRDHREAK